MRELSVENQDDVDSIRDFIESADRKDVGVPTEQSNNVLIILKGSKRLYIIAETGCDGLAELVFYVEGSENK